MLRWTRNGNRHLRCVQKLCNHMGDHRCASQAVAMDAITLLRLSFSILLVCGTCTVRSECLVRSFNISSQNLQYFANLSQIVPPCTPAGVNISKHYIDGECIDNACTARATASNASCSQVFLSPSNEDNYKNLSLLGTPYESTLQFDDFTTCNIPVPNITYFYVNTSTTCTNFDLNWISLHPDSIDCHTYKAYNYGAAIGVIVAVILFLALLIGGWIFWYRRRSQQGVYEPHQDIHMQPFPEGAPSQTYSSALPAQQTASTDRLHPGFPAAGTTPAMAAQGAPVYPPWTGGGFKPTGASTPR